LIFFFLSASDPWGVPVSSTALDLIDQLALSPKRHDLRLSQNLPMAIFGADYAG
jgi:hypothetical protein